MTKRFALLSCMGVAIAIAACSSSSTSPINNGSGPQSPGIASKNDTVNFSGTYDLSTYTIDSADGGHSSTGTDANNSGTLTLTTTRYQLAGTGAYQQNFSNSFGNYVAIDTSSSAQRGTIALYDSVQAKTQNAMYSYANSTLTVTIPDGDGQGNMLVTAWIKQ